jgi:ABC-type multidrug transport system ATPase subunit
VKSEIRPSQLSELRNKVQQQNYAKYLLKINVRRMRALVDTEIRFDFPVTAIVGPNGGGKSTVMGAAACAYKDVAPRKFFAKSGKYDDSMANWQAEYELVDKEIRQQGTLQRTATFKAERWRRDGLDRDVLIFGVARTVPANERPELQRCVTNSFSVDEENVTVLTSSTADAVRKILGKDVSQFSEMMIDTRGRVSLLAGASPGGDSFSEFHFGAGESSIIRMISAIESAPDNALILIEEIENGLHPVATQRMVEYLVDAAERKRIQAIFTTHSEDALKSLPDDAVWAALDGRVQQGKLNIEALRAITGNVDARLVIFVEDEFAKDWLEMCLRYFGNVALDAIEVHILNGSSNAVRIQIARSADPSIQTDSILFLDGDAQESADPTRRILKLLGTTPELFVFNRVLDKLDDLAAKIAVAVHLPVERQADVVRTVRDVSSTNRDPHLLFAQVGDRLGLIAERIIRSAFLSLWAQNYESEVQQLLQPVASLLPVSGPTSSSAEPHIADAGRA